MRCKTCHYSLANLPEHRCPECGRAFDPNDSTSFEGPKVWKFWPMFLRLCAVWFAGAWAFFMFVGWMSAPNEFLLFSVLAATFTLIFVFPIFVLVALTTMGRARGSSRKDA